MVHWAAGTPDPNGPWADNIVVKAGTGSKINYYSAVFLSMIGIGVVLMLYSGWMAFRENQRIESAAQERSELKRIASRAAGRVDMEALQDCTVKQMGGFACMENTVIEALMATGMKDKEARRVATSFVAQLDREELNHLVKFKGIDNLTENLEIHVMRVQQPEAMLAEASTENGSAELSD